MAPSYCVNRAQFWRVGVEELGCTIEDESCHWKYY
jgi:hypothetical protein